MATSLGHSTEPDSAAAQRHRRYDAQRSADANAAAALLEELFTRCEHRLGKFLVQMVGERSLAEDLLQDTFHDAFRARHLLAGIRSPEAWLFGIARHLALNALRRQRRFQRVVTRLTRGSTVSEGTDFELLALRDLLERHLEPEERALLFLRYLHGFDAAELGVMADRTPEAIRQRLARARAKLIAAADSAPDGRQRSQSSEEER